MTNSKEMTTEERHQIFDKLMATINKLPEIEKYVMLELYRASDLTKILKSKESLDEYIEKTNTIITANKVVRDVLPKLYDALNRKDETAKDRDNILKRRTGFFKSFKQNNDEYN